MNNIFILTDKWGRKRKATKKICKNPDCKAEFDCLLSGGQKNQQCCSAACGAILRRTRKVIPCSFCKNRFSIKLSKLNEVKSKLNFCSRKCKDSAQRLDSGEQYGDLRPDHYGVANGLYTYRERALKFYGPRCSVCGYGIEKVLEVHHRDGKRSHNAIENLDVLCPTHHEEYEAGVRSYVQLPVEVSV